MDRRINTNSYSAPLIVVAPPYQKTGVGRTLLKRSLAPAIRLQFGESYVAIPDDIATEETISNENLLKADTSMLFLKKRVLVTTAMQQVNPLRDISHASL